MSSRGILLQIQLLFFETLMLNFIVPTKLATNSPSSSSSSISGVLHDHCLKDCGSVHIPYPFGTKPGCYYNKSFLISCNQTLDPPKAFLPQNNVQILNISLDDGELLVAGSISRVCYDEYNNITSNHSPSAFMNYSGFPLSTRNKFTAVGCDTFGSIGGDRIIKKYWSGCVALCNQTEPDVAENGFCSSVGCCRIRIPQGAMNYETFVEHGILNDAIVVVNRSANPCGYAFVVEEGSYNFSVSDLKSLEERYKYFPVVLDWAIGNLTCEQAKTSNEYACRARKSECLNSNGTGYRCKCPPGFQGNPYLPNGCQDIDECSANNLCVYRDKCENLPGSYKCLCRQGYKGDGKRNGTGCSKNSTNLSSVRVCVALGCSLAILALLLGASWIYWGLKKRKLIKLKEKFFQQNGGLLLQQQLAHLKGSTEAAKIFTENELRRATNNYEESRVLGQGGYGTVYKGVLADNSVVAIKKSKTGNQNQIEQFINEIVVLTQINHRNVVKLLGCCLEAEVPLLVYEFITNGTLYDHIHDKVGKYLPLPWDMRLKIATDTAGAVAYLHSSASMPIIHRDIKTVNILLDENYTAKVSDFGASRLVPLDHTQITTLVQGTLGYLDPEYMHTSQLTEKSDVYSFGVVMAELLTGLKALSFDRPECEVNLSMYFVSSVKEDRVLEIIDKDLIAEENVDQLKAVANIARSCLRMRGEERPSMKEVASELEGLLHKGMHPWEQDKSSSSTEETGSSLYPYNLHETDRTVGSSTWSASIASGFDSITIQALNPSEGDAR